mgnify:FL=1
MRYDGTVSPILSTDHSITQIYIEHYPLEKQMEYNSKLLNLTPQTTNRDELIAQLSSLSIEELNLLLSKMKNV